jgi:hypothetical protein
MVPMCANDRPAARCFNAAPSMPAVDLREREQVPVRVEGALRYAGRAAREHDRDRIVGSTRGRRRLRAERGYGVRRARLQQLARQPDDLAEPVDRRACLRPRSGSPRRQRSTAIKCARAEDVADLRPPVAHVDAGRDHTDAGRSEVRDQVEGRRREQEGDDLARADAACGDPHRDTRREYVPVTVRQSLGAVAERLRVRVFAGGLVQQLSERRRGEHDQPSHSRSRR